MDSWELLQDTRRRLAGAGIENARQESLFLLQHILEQSGAAVLAALPVTQEQKSRLEQLLWRRMQGEPLQYILGQWDFFGRPFQVGPGVLIPRADTESMIERVLDCYSPQEPLRIADLCSGSGCIAITLALELPHSQVQAYEFSKQAMEYLKKNVALHRARNVQLIAADVLHPRGVEPELDCIVSNPPYIATEVIKQLDRQMAFEPRLALDGGSDGLDFYKAICSKWKRFLKPGGRIFFEIGYDQGVSVLEILEQAGFIETQVYADYAGNSRVAQGVLPL